MTRRTLPASCLAVLFGVSLGACQTSPPRPATLEAATPEAMDVLKEVLAEALGRGRIELGGGDPATHSVISVLPPPVDVLEGRSTALPELFDLLVTQEGCFVRRQTTGEMYALPGVACRAVD